MVEHRFQPGHPRWGGRKRGQKNWQTLEREEREGQALIHIIEKLGVPQATLKDLTPISIMQFVMIERFRAGDHSGALSAAQSVAPYLHPKLAMTDVRVTNSTAEKSTAELMAEREELAAKLAAAAEMQQIEGTATELNEDSRELYSGDAGELYSDDAVELDLTDLVQTDQFDEESDQSEQLDQGP